MAKVYLGLGTNCGNRLQHLETAAQKISTFAKTGSLRLSSVYTTPALLPVDAPSSWNKPFLNLVAELEFTGTPNELLILTQKIEHEAGRVRGERWSPRELDVDVLYWQGIEARDASLRVPHPEIKNRAFVLDPLAELAPRLRLPGESGTVLELARRHRQHSPRLMGILNLTPDSFSDGAVNTEAHIEKTLTQWQELPIAFIDIGGESTRPQATPVSSTEEWQRVQPVIALLKRRFAGKLIRPRISLDTRHAEVVAQALAHGGIDILNDVTGLQDKRIVDIVREAEISAIVMHSLSVPVNPQEHLPVDRPASLQVKEWFQNRLAALEQQGLSREKIQLDPGIGFGKTSLQSLEILQSIAIFQDFGVPIVAGHSRKSFQKDFTSAPPAERDPETLGSSFALVEKGVDVLRVHDPLLHHRALLGRAHLL